MGFKCPICMKDFGQSKEKWQDHCKQSHMGAGQDIINIIKDINKKTEKEKQNGKNTSDPKI